MHNFLIAVKSKPIKRHRTVLMYFLNIETLHDVIYIQNKGFLAPSMLFILQFISNKTKVLTLFWDESYHNTSIYHINKKNYNTIVRPDKRRWAVLS